jgi:integrase
MASLFKPTIVTYRLRDGSYRTPDGARVTKDTPGAVKNRSKSDVYYGRYTDGSGRMVQARLSENKDISRRMLNKLAGDAQLVSVGIKDKFGDHNARPLSEHLADFQRYLEGNGSTAGHVKKTTQRVKAIISACNFQKLDSLAAAPVVECLGKLRSDGRARLPLDKDEYTRDEVAAILDVHPESIKRIVKRFDLAATGQGKARRYPASTVEALQDELCRGKGIVTSNHYLVAIKSFAIWLTEEERIPNNPLARLHRLQPDPDLRHQRRAMPEETFARFLEAAANGKPFLGLTGRDRHVLYTLAANTGLRAKELRTLTPASFDFTEPSVSLKAAHSKRRRNDTQPIRADVAEMMADYIGDLRDRTPLWPGKWHEKAAQMVRHDLAAAGIPYRVRRPPRNLPGIPTSSSR